MSNNNFTSIETVMIRRLNRGLQLTSFNDLKQTTQKMTGMLPVHTQIRDGAMIRETVSRNILFLKSRSNGRLGFAARTYTTIRKKKHYWKKWRTEETDEKHYFEWSLHELLKQIKADFCR